MDIRFSATEVSEMRAALTAAGLGTSEATVGKLARAVQAAFEQQLPEEAEHLAESMADGEVAT